MIPVLSSVFSSSCLSIHPCQHTLTFIRIMQQGAGGLLRSGCLGMKLHGPKRAAQTSVPSSSQIYMDNNLCLEEEAPRVVCVAGRRGVYLTHLLSQFSAPGT